MERRELLGLMGAGAVGLVATGGNTARAAVQDLDSDIKTMHECVRLCNEVSHHCLKQVEQGEGDIQDHLKNHHYVMDCQLVCTATAALMARHSPLSKPVHEANAEVCRQCAEVCENSKDKAQIIQQCAEICRECEKMCRRYAQQGQAGGSR